MRSTAKHLLLDTRIVDHADNARLTLGAVTKDPHNPLFVEDRPWEARFDNLYANVLRDPADGLYKCWYNPFLYMKKSRPDVSRETGLCYAESQDGIAWEKPDLGLIEFEGATENNLVMRICHGAGVWLDANDPDPQRRFKMFYKTQEERTPEQWAEGRMWLKVAASPDGLRWTDLPGLDMPKYPYKQADTHNNFLWDAPSQRWVAFTRTWYPDPREDRPAYRIVARMESRDLLKWTRPLDILRELPEEVGRRQTYAMPVFPYAGVYLGLLMMFQTGDPDDPQHDTVECELAWSPNTVHWYRVCPGQSLVPRGPEGSFDSHIVYGACSPVVLEDEIRLYYGGCNGPHGGERAGGFGLARLRPDGFAGFEPCDPDQPGVVETRPVRCAGRTLTVSADAEGGELRVAVAGTDGLESEPVAAAVTDAAVSWKDGADLGPLKDRHIVLRFELRKAALYAFGFSD